MESDGAAILSWLPGVAHGAARALELAGIVAICGGVLYATVMAARRVTAGGPDLYTHYRRGLAQAILVGLELLVAADIIGTIAVEPTWSSVGVLAVIVLIRTVLSVSLEVEIEGTWPWRQREQRN